MTSLDALPPMAAAGIDRAAAERADPALLDRLRALSSSRVLVIAGDRAPLAAPGVLLHVAPGDAPRDAVWAVLGRDDEGAGVLLAAVAGTEGPPFAAPAGWGGLREVGGDLDAADAAAFVSGLALGRWLLDAPHCPACGAVTLLEQAGWSRRCPSCGREHFPRTDPAVIVAVRSARDPDLLLLGSNALWGVDRYSCFAGFAEAGESLEAAALREVREESGIELATIEYRGSQAWPYPRSLMVGFLGTAADDTAHADGDEIAAVRWFHRDEVGAALSGGGALVLPGRASIAHRLIADWHAESP